MGPTKDDPEIYKVQAQSALPFIRSFTSKEYINMDWTWTYHNAVPFVSIESFANGYTGWMFTKYVHHFQLTFFNDNIQCIWIQFDAFGIFNVVIDEQTVR